MTDGQGPAGGVPDREGGTGQGGGVGGDAIAIVVVRRRAVFLDVVADGDNSADDAGAETAIDAELDRAAADGEIDDGGRCSRL